MGAPEIRTKPPSDLEVLDLFGALRDIAYNLWWSWSSLAHQMFSRIDPHRWKLYRNPIQVLIDLEPERWQTLQNDDEFTRIYHSLVRQFEDYTKPTHPTWFDRHHPDYQGGPFAYFSTEYGWHESLHLYSGGLGVLSGDHCKSASDLGLPFIGIGLMYKHGYFRQSIDADGNQQHFYPFYDVQRLPLLPVVNGAGKELHVGIELPGRRVHLRVWKAGIGRVPVLLLDSDLPINHPADRPITSVLYVRGREMRLCQEIVLGMGGARVLDALGIRPAVWHMNEGHSALLALQRARDLVERDGVSLHDALRRNARDTLFTTHTPIPAGNEAFSPDLIRKYFTGLAGRCSVDVEELLALGRGVDPHDGAFNMTALALRSAGRANGVSELHGRVANSMWHPLTESEGRRRIEHITNGVHLPSWIGPDIEALLRRYVGPDFDERLLEPGFAEAVGAIPDNELWTAHCTQKRRLVTLVRERVMEQLARHGQSPDNLRELERLLDPAALTIGFARRFATYKRADLILRDAERLKSIMTSPSRPVQIIYAGKAHPADRPGQEIIRRIFEASQDTPLRHRLVFIESYDMRLARHLVQGVDVWLNTPRRPQEASGTSGMKAVLNGVLNLSILDGWWCEGFDPSLGWAIGDRPTHEQHHSDDEQDAHSLYRVLSEEVVPCFYENIEYGLPVAWIRRMKTAIAKLSPRFSTARMVTEYTERYYLPAGRGEL